MQFLTLQALALAQDFGSGGFGRFAVFQRGDSVVDDSVAFGQRLALQGADGGGVALQLQQLALQALALAQDVGGAAQGFGGLVACVGHVLQHRGDAGEGAAELHKGGEHLATGFCIQIFCCLLHQLAVSIARGGQGQAQAAQGFGELRGGLGGALGFGEELGVIDGRGLGEVLQAAEGVGQLAGQVGAGQAGGVEVQAKKLERGVDGAQAAGQAGEGLDVGFAGAGVAGAGGFDGAGDFAHLVHEAVEHRARLGFGPAFHLGADGFGDGAGGAQRQAGQLFLHAGELLGQLFLDLVFGQALEAEADVLREVSDFLGALAHGLGQQCGLHLELAEAGRQGALQLGVCGGERGLVAAQQAAFEELEGLALKAGARAEGALQAHIGQAAAEDAVDGAADGPGDHAADRPEHVAGHGRADVLQRGHAFADLEAVADGLVDGHAGCGAEDGATGRAQGAGDGVAAAGGDIGREAGAAVKGRGQAQLGAQRAFRQLHEAVGDGGADAGVDCVVRAGQRAGVAQGAAAR